jgi:hypothetical protein
MRRTFLGREMRRDPQILAQIEEIDALLENSGVRHFCNMCWKGKLKGITHTVGCCNGPKCELLGKDGCTNKPLNCALWLCDAARKFYPTVAAQLDVIKDKWPAELADPYINFRKASLDFELSQLK